MNRTAHTNLVVRKQQKTTAFPRILAEWFIGGWVPLHALAFSHSYALFIPQKKAARAERHAERSYDMISNF